MKRQLQLMLCVLLPMIGYAQWGTDNTNLLCASGSQGSSLALKNKVDNDGNYLTTFYDADFKLYYQIFNKDGEKKFDAPFLVSDKPHLTYIADYATLIDKDNHLIIAHSDIQGSDLPNIVLYKLDNNPAHLWPAEGVRITSDNNYNETPILAEDPDGNILVFWQTIQDFSGPNSYLGCMKISPQGELMFDEPKTITLPGRDVSFPAIHFNADGSFFLIVDTQAMFGASGHIEIMKYDTDLNSLFEEPTQITVNPGATALSPQEAKIDAAGDLWVCWSETRFNVSKYDLFVQKVGADGSIKFEEGGVNVAVIPQNMAKAPKIIDFTSENDAIIAYVQQNMNQSTSAFMLQKISVDGNRTFGETGKILVPEAATNGSLIHTQKGENNFILVSSDYVDENMSSIELHARAFDYEGNQLWNNETLALSNQTLPLKGGDVTPVANGQWVVSWEEGMQRQEKTYLQNITLDGQRGVQTSIQPVKDLENQVIVCSDKLVFTEEPANVTVYDVMGRMVNMVNQPGSQLLMENYREGVYLITVETKDKHVHKVKFLKRD